MGAVIRANTEIRANTVPTYLKHSEHKNIKHRIYKDGPAILLVGVWRKEEPR